jgi:hypothetical protein
MHEALGLIPSTENNYSEFGTLVMYDPIRNQKGTNFSGIFGGIKFGVRRSFRNAQLHDSYCG